MLYAKRSVLMLAESSEALHRRLNRRGSSARLVGSNQSANGELGGDLWGPHSPPQTCIRGTVSTIGKLPRASGSRPRLLDFLSVSKQSCRSDALGRWAWLDHVTPRFRSLPQTGMRPARTPAKSCYSVCSLAESCWNKAI